MGISKPYFIKTKLRGKSMKPSTVLLFTRNGLGEGPAELQQTLAEKYLSLTLASNDLPNRILFYTEGVHLACEGSRVLPQLTEMQSRGVELVICKTCTDTFGVTGKVKVGVIGGMPDILETLQKADKVISL
jgi:sulfur relay (sulfurtransferase) complex TusBCD TusD component (DsrE family)